jgi:hypothetical protein
VAPLCGACTAVKGEPTTSATGWKQLLAGWPWFRGEGRFPLPAYSELMPPPYLVRKPYGGWDLSLPRDEFSDAGLPALLFMENYDTNRAGYHDGADDLGNIDLDYGSVLAAITIEAVARLATEEPPAT